MQTIIFPPGNLGLELVAANNRIYGGGSPTGMKVQSWSSSSTSANNAIEGSTIVSVDNINTENLPFQEAVRILRESPTRIVKLYSSNKDSPRTLGGNLNDSGKHS